MQMVDNWYFVAGMCCGFVTILLGVLMAVVFLIRAQSRPRSDSRQRWEDDDDE